MRYIKTLFMIIFFLSSLYAITPEELLRKANKKYGKYKIENYVIETNQIYSFPGMPQMTSHQVLYKKGNKIRIETDIDMGETPMKTLFIGDGKNMYFISGGQTQTMPYDSTKLKEDYFWWEYIKPHDIKIEGEEKIDNYACYVLSVNNNNIDKIWVGKDNFLVRKEEKNDPNIGKVYVILSDYRVYDNLYFPYKMDIYMDTLRIGDVKTLSIKTGININDSLFVVPENKDESLKDMMNDMMDD